MLMSNWYMINTFVSNLGTATVLVFVTCKLTYCIEFTKFVYIFFPYHFAPALISHPFTNMHQKTILIIIYFQNRW